MSEWRLLQTVKLTLCKIVLAACAVLPLTIAGCGAIPSASVPRAKVEQKTDKVLNDALEYIANREYAEAQWLLEERNKYEEEQTKTILRALGQPPNDIPTYSTYLSPSEQMLLAISYAQTRNYDKAESQFRNLLTRFKENPEKVMDNINRNLEGFFKTKRYEEAEKTASSGILFYPELRAVVGFMKFARKDYAGARRYFESTVPMYDYSVIFGYRLAFAKLLAHAGKKNDNKLILEHAKTLGTLYNTFPKPITYSLQIKPEERRLYELGMDVAEACKKGDDEILTEARKFISIYNSEQLTKIQEK